MAAISDGPELVSAPGVSLVSPGEDGVLTCSVDANPITENTLSWHRDSFDWASSRVSVFSRNGTSYLTVHNVTKEDTGQFQCRADNGVGQAAATAALLVKRERCCWCSFGRYITLNSIAFMRMRRYFV